MSRSGYVQRRCDGLALRSALLAVVLVVSGVAQTQSSSTMPASARALYKEGTTLMQAGRLAEAQRVLEQAEREAPGSVEIKITLGKLDAVLGRNNEAIRLFREVEAASPANSESEVNLAIALAARGALEDALLTATKAVAGNPQSPGAHHIRGKILASLNRPGEAQTEYDAALALAPADPLVLHDYAQFCEDASKLPAEVSLLQRLVKVRPGKAQDHFLLARALSRTGDQDGSQREYRETIRLDPENRAALYSLSRALHKEDPAEAERLAERFRALRVSDEEINAIRTKGNEGVAAMQSREWARAIAIFESALTSCAGCTLDATLEKDLGLSQCQAGDTVAGANSLRRSLALNPSDPDTVRALDMAERANSTAKR